jgi:hypothetical protein
MSQKRSTAVDPVDLSDVVACMVLSAAAAVAISLAVLCSFCAISASISSVAVKAEAEMNIKA